jgi:hypothetical protein
VRRNFARRKLGVSVVAAVAASRLLTLLSAMTFAREKTECTLPDWDQAKAFFSKFQMAIEATVFKTKSQLLAEYDRGVYARRSQCDSIRVVVGCVGELAGIHDQRGRDLVGPRYSELGDEYADVGFVEVSVWRLYRKSFASVGRDVSGESGCAGAAVRSQGLAVCELQC